MSRAPEPALSIVLLTPDRYERVRKTMRHLRAQHARENLEVILGAPVLADLEPDPRDRDSFHSFHLIETGPIHSTGIPRAMAAGLATAPAIVFAEDHCFPEPDWADALIAAFGKSYAAVGATLSNANPGSSISWASLVLNFGPVVKRTASGEGHFIPWHNSGYRTDLLRRYSLAQLGNYLSVEGLLHADLERAGGKLYLCAEARTAHTNASVWRSFLREQFHGARLYWRSRAVEESWPLAKRIGFAMLAPGLGAVRLWRAIAELGRIGCPENPLRLAPFLLAGVCAITAGAVASLFGLGNSMAFRISAEFYRIDHVRAEDRPVLLS